MKKATPLLLSTNIIVYTILAKLSSSRQIDRYFIDIFGLSREVLINQHYYWQIITSFFLHLNFSHLSYNLLLMAMYTYLAEELYPWKKVLAIYFFSGISVSIAIFLAYPNAVFGGASGAVLGLVGATLASQRLTRLTLLGITALIFFALVSNVYLAHFVGIGSGYFFAKYIIPKMEPITPIALES